MNAKISLGNNKIDSNSLPLVQLKKKKAWNKKPCSISFFALERNEIMHSRFHGTIKYVILLRGFLYGIPEFMNLLYKGKDRCDTVDTAMHTMDVATGQVICQPFTAKWYREKLKQDISFRLYQYEKQLLYLKAMNYFAFVALARYLYCSIDEKDADPFDFTQIPHHVLPYLVKSLNFDYFYSSCIRFKEVDYTRFPKLK